MSFFNYIFGPKLYMEYRGVPEAQVKCDDDLTCIKYAIAFHLFLFAEENVWARRSRKVWWTNTINGGCAGVWVNMWVGVCVYDTYVCVVTGWVTLSSLDNKTQYVFIFCSCRSFGRSAITRHLWSSHSCTVVATWSRIRCQHWSSCPPASAWLLSYLCLCVEWDVGNRGHIRIW